MNREQELIIIDWINEQIDEVVGLVRNARPMVWTMLHKANLDFSYPQPNPANDPFAMFCVNSLIDLFGQERSNRMIRGAIGLEAPRRVVIGEYGPLLVKEADPELERLLAEEEEIERRWKENQ